ncbi:MAG: hypothetical protein JXB85_10630 [Anaerolineales bacterium]|nr:hypothetical protein [Anaerolineales bacterium]
MKINSKTLGIIILVVLFGGIALSATMGWWQTSGGGGGSGGGNGQGSSGSQAGQGAHTDEGSQEVGNDGNPEDRDNRDFHIRGRTTFQELLDWGLPVEIIETVIGGPLPDPATRINRYCSEQGLDFETVKEALQLELDRLAGGE